MTVVLELEPDLLARLEQRASARHQTVPEYLHALADADTRPQEAAPPRQELSVEEKIALLYRLPDPARAAPPIPEEALRREALYEDRV